MLALEVEFLTGVSVAASPYRRDEAEWPPHPDRVFQALVAAWGRNDPPDEEERGALEWLQELGAPEVAAPPAHRRTVVTVYVPPNDAATAGRPGGKPPKDLAAAVRVVPELRRNRQARNFPAVLPAGVPAVVRYLWRDAAAERHRGALARIVREVVYLGHSHTLVRMAWVEPDDPTEIEPAEVETKWLGQTGQDLRLPYRGRLAELTRCHAEDRRPPVAKLTRRYAPPAAAPVPATTFDGRMVTVFAGQGSIAPALDAFPLVARRMRDALLCAAGRSGLAIPRLLSGHEADGAPTDTPHLAVVPLADVGWEHASGRLLGLGLVWPEDMPPAERDGALRILARLLDDDDRIALKLGVLGRWSLRLDPEPDRASLRFGRYARAARQWGTVLPFVFDRFPKSRAGKDMPALVCQACVNAGLPAAAVDGLEIEVHKHAPVRGAPSAPRVEGALPADSPYRGRPMRHLVLTFPQPVQGPLLLGAGRFRGLGLCLPLDEGEAR